MDHLFVGCLFMKKMILGLNCLFEVNILWTAPTFMENISNWVSKNGFFTVFAPFSYLEYLEG